MSDERNKRAVAEKFLSFARPSLLEVTLDDTGQGLLDYGVFLEHISSAAREFEGKLWARLPRMGEATEKFFYFLAMGEMERRSLKKIAKTCCDNEVLPARIFWAIKHGKSLPPFPTDMIGVAAPESNEAENSKEAVG